MLTDAERAEIKALIESEIEDMKNRLDQLKERTGPVEPDAAIGRLSRLDSMINAGTVSMAMEETRKRLGKLRDKLTQIDDPDFGQCANCGQPIAMERLRVAPERGVCMPCLRQLRKGR
ncbi:MAG: TraR/DksA C4-type zinc finger protein [Sumerlaeia bacterium]